MTPEAELTDSPSEITDLDIDNTSVADAETDQPRRRRHRLRWIAGLAAIALAASTVVVVRSRQHTASAAGGTAVSAKELEAKYGTRIDMVAVTALGGLVQLRFTVLDKSKAEKLFHVAEKMPSLEAEDSGKILLAPIGMRHHVTLLDGASYFVLYANAGNALAMGTHVSVLIDTVKLEHLVAQG